MTRKNIAISIGQKLRAKRLQLSMTQTDLAKQMNITFQQIQKYENGLNELSVFRLLQICNTLDVNVSYFLEDVNIENELKNFVGSDDVQQNQETNTLPVVQTSSQT